MNKNCPFRNAACIYPNSFSWGQQTQQLPFCTEKNTPAARNILGLLHLFLAASPAQLPWDRKIGTLLPRQQHIHGLSSAASVMSPRVNPGMLHTVFEIARGRQRRKCSPCGSVGRRGRRRGDDGMRVIGCRDKVWGCVSRETQMTAMTRL